MKFGGTSVKEAEAIKRVENIVSPQESKVLIVVSALSGVTNKLVEIISCLDKKTFNKAFLIINELELRHKELAEKLNVSSACAQDTETKISFLNKIVDSVDILGEVTLKTKDLILSTGELLSSSIIYQFFVSRGFSIAYADPRGILKTVPLYGETEVDWGSSEEAVNNHLSPLFHQHHFIITGGYVGSDNQGKTTTLGRGGSDYSAAIFASLLHAERLEIWTDVDGILTAEPRMIPHARLVKDVTYAEASELAYFGAKVLHPKTIFPSIEQNIPVYVMNTFHPENNGTRIMAQLQNGNKIKAITFRRNITIINIQSNRMLGAYGFLSQVFEVFNRHETSVDLVSTSEVSISVTIDNQNHIEELRHDLERISTVAVYPEKAILSAIGEGIREDSGIAARFFTALNGINVSLVTMGASEINLSIVVDEDDLENAVKLLHLEFFE